MRRTVVAADAARAPPNGFDPVEQVSCSLARVPRPWEVEVLLDLRREVAASACPRRWLSWSSWTRGTLLTMRVSSLDWMARVLAGLDCDPRSAARTSSEGASGHWRIAWPPPPER